MPRKASARSTSKGRKAAAPPKVMDFQEGDEVLAKWPGTNLYFQAKVTYVREEDDEYDVQV